MVGVPRPGQGRPGGVAGMHAQRIPDLDRGSSEITRGAVRTGGCAVNDGRGGKITPWPKEVRVEALKRCAEVGPGQTSREMNISENTLKSWMKRASAKAHAELARADVVMPARKGVSWRARREVLLASMGELVEESVAAARLCTQQGRSKCASDFANVASRMIDKCALLGGDVTSRSESRSLALHMEGEGLRSVQEEGRRIVEAREAQLERGDGDGAHE
jgi:transposase-like protein